MQRHYLFGVLKGVVFCYWVAVLWSFVTVAPGAFAKLLSMTAPAVVSLHFLQVLIFGRVLQAQKSYWRHLLLTLAFGAFHIGQLLLMRAPASAKRP